MNVSIRRQRQGGQSDRDQNRALGGRLAQDGSADHLVGFRRGRCHRALSATRHRRDLTRRRARAWRYLQLDQRQMKAKGRTASGRLRKGYRLTKGGRVVKAKARRKSR